LANRSFPKQGCYHLLSGLLATCDRTFVGSLPDGTPVSADLFLFPGHINLPSVETSWPKSIQPRHEHLATRPARRGSPSEHPARTLPRDTARFLQPRENRLATSQVPLRPQADSGRSAARIHYSHLVPLLATFQGCLFLSAGPTLQDAKKLLSNIQWLLDLSVTEISAPALAQSGWQPPSHESPFRSSLLYEALRDLDTYFLGRHLPLTWNALPLSRC
jgi:hypothetical protein